MVNVQTISAKDAAHLRTAGDAALELGVDPRVGLASDEVLARRARWGENELPEAEGRSPAVMLVAQFRNVLIALLLVAIGIALAIGEWVNAVTIAAIVVLSVLLGFIQERRAGRALERMRDMTAPVAKVLRDGTVREIPAREIVPGDLVLLDVGNYVPADVRLVESHSLEVNEASLTGESVPSVKDAAITFGHETPVADRSNCAFGGTIVTRGRGVGVVVAIGSETQIGRIAELVARPEEPPTPLQERISDLGRYLGGVAIAISATVFVVGVLRGLDTGDMALTAISLAVAAVPEGLPAVVVVSLALGMQRMAKRNALIRTLPTVETLGSATVIASDKTGTLTTGEMTVTAIYLGPERELVEVTGVGFGPAGKFITSGQSFDARSDAHLRRLLIAGSLCNDARLESDGGRWHVVGDTTEGALAVVAAKAGLDWEELEPETPRVGEIPFTSERSLMTTLHAAGDHFVAYMKGAPEIVLQRCSARRIADHAIPLSEEGRDAIRLTNHNLASAGLRVLALAYRRIDDLSHGEAEREMTFLGLLAMADPPREEARDAVAYCIRAGIRPVMITGDHAGTAAAIAAAVGIDGRAVVTGEEIERMTDGQLRAAVDGASVFARITAAEKVQIVEALQASGEVVAVTGDGVNDAPALRRADIGVAMGITGTDVAKEASDIVIIDDNFASIVAAVEEGRHIFNNIRNFVVYLLGGNISEILVVFVAVVAGLPLPLLPAQILFVNFVTDGPPALALGVEPGDPEETRRPPHRRSEPIISREIWAAVALRGVILAASVLAAYTLWYEGLDRSVEESRTVAFVTLVLAHVLKAETCRSLYRPAWSLGFFSNRWLLVGIGISVGALFLALYVPPFTDAFTTETIGAMDWLVILGFALAAPLVIDAVKLSPWRLRR
jgi:Ca2+-transporting ATPase